MLKKPSNVVLSEPFWLKKPQNLKLFKQIQNCPNVITNVVENVHIVPQIFHYFLHENLFSLNPIVLNVVGEVFSKVHYYIFVLLALKELKIAAF